MPFPPSLRPWTCLKRCRSLLTRRHHQTGTRRWVGATQAWFSAASAVGTLPLLCCAACPPCANGRLGRAGGRSTCHQAAAPRIAYCSCFQRLHCSGASPTDGAARASAECCHVCAARPAVPRLAAAHRPLPHPLPSPASPLAHPCVANREGEAGVAGTQRLLTSTGSRHGCQAVPRPAQPALVHTTLPPSPPWQPTEKKVRLDPKEAAKLKAAESRQANKQVWWGLVGPLCVWPARGAHLSVVCASWSTG